MSFLLYMFLFLPLLIHSFPLLFKPRSEVVPPHCISTPFNFDHPSSGGGLSKSLTMRFSIGLHATVCFRLEHSKHNSTEPKQSLLHTITFARIEHHHPVNQKYNFGIPEVHANCICECESTSKCSPSNYGFTKCPEVSKEKHECYRTFFPHQSNKSCATSSSMGSNLCCEVTLSPYESKTYTAIRLGEPSTFAYFTYVAYDYAGNTWIERDKNTMTISIDGRTQEIALDVHGFLKLAVSASGRAAHQLESGMYFTQYKNGGEMDGIRKEYINEFSDCDVHKLGWYRRNETSGKFYVPYGEVVVRNLHGAKVNDCKEQNYTSMLAANFYMPDKFSLPPYVEELHHWINKAAFQDGSMRHAIVSHSEGTSLNIGLRADIGMQGDVIFLHNSSRINSFDGSILIDSRSRLFLNLSLFATGKINGMIYISESAEKLLYSFSVYVPEVSPTNRSFLVPLPANIERGHKLVCMKAEEDSNHHCHDFTYHEEALEVNVEANSWRELKGHCPDCNPESHKSFFDKLLDMLNLLKHFEGLKSVVTDFTTTKAADFIIYVIGVLFLYVLITKIILPLCQCCLCPLLIARLNERRVDRRWIEEQERMERKRRRSRAQKKELEERRQHILSREQNQGETV